jgi:hypothetical protein
MSKYETHRVMKTKCESLYDIYDLVAEFFIDNRDEEEVTVEDDKLGKFEFTIYASDIVKAINSKLQVAHFGGTLE